MKALFIAILILFTLVLVGWLGLQIQPAPFPPYPGAEPASIETAPLPEGLPAPVERFYRTLYGDRIPVVESAVISGRMQLRFMGITFPGRFRFTHEAGQNYRHYIEATLFGLPVLRVNEHYLEGHSRLELPFGVTENDPKVDAAANQGLWAESLWMPALLVTDPRVDWEAVDDETALLIVPYGGSEQTFVARFDEISGRLHLMSTMRYSDTGDKDLWINEVYRWGAVNGHPTLESGGLIWLEEGTPWAIFDTQELLYNVDVSEYVRARGL